MVWIPHFRDFIYIPLSSRPNILFPLLNAPWTCPLGNPFVSCTDLGQISLQLPALFWWFFGASFTSGNCQ